MDLGLKGKAVLMTGASRGIGLAAAQAFAHEGAHLAIVARGEKDLETAKAAVQAVAEGGEVLALPCDVAKLESLPALVDAVVGKWGKLDVLVNNAGAGRYKPFLEVSMQELSDTYHLNVFSAYRLCQLVVPIMKDNGGGAIVNVGGISGIQAPKYPLFATASGPTKAAIYNFSKTLAAEFGRDNIRVNCLMPGLTLTPRFEEMILKAAGGDREKVGEQMKQWGKDILLKDRRWATSEEIGDLIVMLASERASYVTGAGVIADGGIVRAL